MPNNARTTTINAEPIEPANKGIENGNGWTQKRAHRGKIIVNFAHSLDRPERAPRTTNCPFPLSVRGSARNGKESLNFSTTNLDIIHFSPHSVRNSNIEARTAAAKWIFRYSGRAIVAEIEGNLIKHISGFALFYYFSSEEEGITLHIHQ